MSEWTPERHEAAKARCDAATNGLWFDMGWVVTQAIGGNVAQMLGKTEMRRANARFIAEARTDLPDTLAEIERLKVEFRELAAELRAGIKDADFFSRHDVLAVADYIEEICGGTNDAL